MVKHAGQPVKIYLRGRIYHFTISTVINRQRIFVRESTHTEDKQQAERYALKRLNQIVEQAEYRTDPSKLKNFTLDQAFGLFWDEVGQYHANSNDTYSKLSILSAEFDTSLPLQYLTIDDIALFVGKKRAEGKQNSTINRYLALLSAIMTLCKKRRVATPEINIREFMLKEKAENIKYIPDWQTLDRILNAAATHLKPIILAALYTGFRKSTLLSLKWENIIGDEIIVKVKDSQYDGGKTVSQKLFPELRRLIFSQPKVSDYIFTYKGQRVKDIKTAWHSIFKKTGLPYVNFHTLRHTSGTWLLRETGNLKFVQKHLGHSSTKVTEKYAHIIDDERASVLQTAFCRRDSQQSNRLPVPANESQPQIPNLCANFVQKCGKKR